MPPVKPFLAIGTILVAVGLVTATPAGAQTREQKAGARAAADAGGDAFDAGKYAEAADLFERAERLMHAPPHLLYAARSHVKLGHLVEARELYLTLTRENLPGSAPRVFRDAQQMGEKELADIEPRIPYVSVVVQGGAGASSLHVIRNGEPVPPELLGIPTPVNPGDYSYQALADGMESTATTVKLREGVRETVLLTLRNIPGYVKPAQPGAAPTNASAPSSGSSLSTPASDSNPSGGGGGRPLLVGAIAGFGIAAVGGVVGTLFLIKSNETADKSQALFEACAAMGTCPNDSTPAALEIADVDSDESTQRGVAIVSYVVGGVGLATGITLLILDQNRSNATAKGPSVTPLVGLNYLGVAGRF
jgi:hypothetical protein